MWGLCSQVKNHAILSVNMAEDLCSLVPLLSSHESRTHGKKEALLGVF